MCKSVKIAGSRWAAGLGSSGRSAQNIETQLAKAISSKSSDVASSNIACSCTFEALVCTVHDSLFLEIAMMFLPGSLANPDFLHHSFDEEHEA